LWRLPAIDNSRGDVRRQPGQSQEDIDEDAPVLIRTKFVAPASVAGPNFFIKNDPSASSGHGLGDL
jgi:hypothetical protein